MQRSINKRLSRALRENNRDELDEETGEVEEEEEEEERPKRSRNRTSTPSGRNKASPSSGRKKASPSSSKTKSSTEQKRLSSQKTPRVSGSREEVGESEEREVTRKPSRSEEREVTRRASRSDSRKPSPNASKRSFGFGEFRNSRLGAAFATEASTAKQNELEEEEEEEELPPMPPTVEEDEIPSDEEVGVSPPPEEEVQKRSPSSSSKVDLRRKSSSTKSESRTSLKDSSRPTRSPSSTKNKRSSSKESLRRSTSKKSLPPTYYPPVNKPPNFNEEKPRLSANNVAYFDEIDDNESSPPESSTTSFTRPLGLSSSAVRLPPLYDLRPSSGGYNYPRGASSREVTALPIEIPESVTDEAAFRRYLAVRRGAFYVDPTSFSLEEVNANVNSSSYESVGGVVGVGGSKLPAQMALMQQTLLAQLEGNKRTMTLSYAIMTLALLSASATQLRFLVAYSKAHAYSVLNYILVCLCIFIEVGVGLGYVVLSRFTSISEERVESIHNYLISGLFVVAVANVIIAAFAFDDHVCEVLAKQTELFDSVDQSPQQTEVT